MVPAQRSVSREWPAGAARPPERELLEAVARAYAERGYRAYLDPDGTDYFDLAVRRGEEVGLVEGKVGQPSEVLVQALRRRPWADWVAVVVSPGTTAARLVARTSGRRSAGVGVWAYDRGTVRELRPPVVGSGEGADPFVATRERFRRVLIDLDEGRLPIGVRWSGVVAAVRRASGGRSFSEWRLDEREDRPR
jgi:hypothetical protein